jgi:hypothetical protein
MQALAANFKNNLMTAINTLILWVLHLLQSASIELYSKVSPKLDCEYYIRVAVSNALAPIFITGIKKFYSTGPCTSSHFTIKDIVLWYNKQNGPSKGATTFSIMTLSTTITKSKQSVLVQLSIKTHYIVCCYAEYHLCWMSLSWVSLCRVSWRPL